MTDFGALDAQVALYIDWDNIVISRYDELHGRNAFRDDRANSRRVDRNVEQKLSQARIDLAAILEFASSYGTVAIARAYANWADALNATYAPDTLRASIDLVQLFPSSKTKNGSDIRLAIDVIDDLSRHGHLTHVVVVAGDSDYISLAQRCKRLGRGVIGVGIARHTGRFWESACDEFRYYSNLPGVAGNELADATDGPFPAPAVDADNPDAAARALLVRATALGHARAVGDWVSGSGLKVQMKRLDPSFDESLLGHKTFTQFVKAYPDLVYVRTDESGTSVRLVSLGPPDHHDDDNEHGTAPALAPARAHSAPLLADTATPPAAAAVGDRVAALRRELNMPVAAVFGTAGERAGVRGMRLAWALSEQGELRGFPKRPIAQALMTEGVEETTARRAAEMIGLVSVLTRDPSLRYEPNVELSGLGDDHLLSVLRQAIASRLQHRAYPDTVTADVVAEVVHGAEVPVGAVASYKHALEVSPLQTMAAALGPFFLPAPVLWDLAVAVTQVPAAEVLATSGQFRAAVAQPFDSLERDIDTVPIDAAYAALRQAGVFKGPDAEVRNALAGAQPNDVADRLVRLWIRTLLERKLLEPAELMSMESLYRLVLPDRMQTEGRAWVRSLVAVH